jgi:putative peptidoglycan lipid II flippase
MKTMSSAKPTPAHSGPADSKAVQSGEVRSSAIMAAGTLVSRFLGFAKTWMLAAALGLGSTVNDTFINANNLPNLIFLLVAGGVFNAVLVPRSSRPARLRTRGRTTSAGC